MKFGVHVSAAGGLLNAPQNAKNLGCETYQFFSRSPRGGKPKPIDKRIADQFKFKNKELGFDSYYIHTPYYINFASGNRRIAKGSVEVVRQELERGDLLGVTATMTHLGSAKDMTIKQAIKQTAYGIIKVLKNYQGKNRFLIEIAAGSGQIIGSNFEEIAEIINLAEKEIKHHKIGVCFDTAHAFASGYDLRNKEQVKKTFRKFDQTVGLDRLVVMHVNDSKIGLGEKKDRHENIGKGKIGKNAFAAILAYKKFQNLDFILETPWITETAVKKDLQILKDLRLNL